MWTSEVLLLLTTVLVVLYFWIKRHYAYWKRQNVPFIEPNPIMGNLKELLLFKISPAEHFQNIYEDEKAKNEPYIGLYIFHQPALLIREPELIKQILVKDFNKFSNRFADSDKKDDKLGFHNLFLIKNPEWKQIRAKLTPVFTSGKMKQMFGLVDDIGHELDSYLLDLPLDAKTKSTEKEIKDICALFTTDVIATVAFGLKANSIKNPEGDFRRNSKKFFDFTLARALDFIGVFFLPKLVPLFKLKVFSKETSEFLRSTVSYVMKERERTGETRNDLIDALVSFKKSSLANRKSEDEIVFDGDVLVAQAAVFFSAGFETSSSAMAFSLYELSKRPDLQKRLRDEIKDVLVKNNGKLTYEDIHSMEYLNMVIQETLRMYPPLPFLDRECTLSKDEKSYSLEPFGKYEIPPGMPVLIPIYAIQRDPKYFADPDTFDPERFAPENKDNILPYTYMPFGTGPHNCIGERFGVMQAKIGIVNFLKNHYVRASAKTHKTMKLDKKAFITQSEGGIYCDILRDPLLA